MKKVQLESFGLQELSHNEMQEIDGGGKGGWLRRGLENLAKAFYLGASDAYHGFVDGFNEGQAERH